jgi:hypothetical protein
MGRGDGVFRVRGEGLPGIYGWLADFPASRSRS